MSNILHSWHKGKYFNRKTSSPKNVNVQIMRKTLHLNLHSFASYSTSSVQTLTGKNTQQERTRMTGHCSTVKKCFWWSRASNTSWLSFIQQRRERACFIHDENRKNNLNQQCFLPQFGIKALFIILTYC